uniref:Uncharacterized protein n=1 Tax=Lepeophtheirus salmonis TaxID=72036 RepID=A0A0K2V165_LEPSM
MNTVFINFIMIGTPRLSTTNNNLIYVLLFSREILISYDDNNDEAENGICTTHTNYTISIRLSR